MFLLYATHLVDPSLTNFLDEFPDFALALIPDIVVPEAELGFLSGLSPIARIVSQGNPQGSGARLIGWRPVLAKSPLRHRVSAEFNKGGGATMVERPLLVRDCLVVGKLPFISQLASISRGRLDALSCSYSSAYLSI